jgi:hypothetical protein
MGLFLSSDGAIKKTNGIENILKIIVEEKKSSREKKRRLAIKSVYTTMRMKKHLIWLFA